MALGSGRNDEGGRELDVLVVGGGQAGLAVGYYLRRTGLSFAIFDATEGPGGAWRRGWDSLRAFSPARWSSLPGRIMPGGTDGYPTRDEVVSYLADYEDRYGLPVYRPVRVGAVERRDGVLAARMSSRAGTALVKVRAVVSATGTWSEPYVPDYPGKGAFRGDQVHSALYREPEAYAGEKVLVVGGGNSAAQILAEVSRVADTTWATRGGPRFLPDDVDGRVLFERATERYRVRREDREAPPIGSLGDVVMVPPVKEARERGVLESAGPFERFTETWVVWPDQPRCCGRHGARTEGRTLGAGDAGRRRAADRPPPPRCGACAPAGDGRKSRSRSMLLPDRSPSHNQPPRTALPRSPRRPAGRVRARFRPSGLDRPHGATKEEDDVNDKSEETSKPIDEQGVTHILNLADPERGDDLGEFQGYHHDASVSFIVVDAPPGGGPRLHRHPYEEVFVVQEGTATFTAGDEQIEVKGGQVVVVPAGVAHKFVNSGEERLRQVDIHASERFVTEWLEEPEHRG